MLQSRHTAKLIALFTAIILSIPFVPANAGELDKATWNSLVRNLFVKSAKPQRRSQLKTVRLVFAKFLSHPLRRP